MERRSLPEPVRIAVGDAELVPVTVGLSTATTFRVSRAEGDRYLKVQAIDPLDTSLVEEGARLQWLADHVPVPDVVEVGTDGSTEWLLTTALAGTDATNPEHHVDVECLVRTLGAGLRRFHDEVPVDDCPFDGCTATALDRARARVEAGLVDESDFGVIHRGMSAVELFEMVASRVPGDDDLVVLHGDYCVPNVVLADRAITGYLDVGRAGVGDRHRDLGIACRSIAHNFGGHAVGVFVDAYGIDRPDLARLDFFVMLDEFF
jgi:aminoglycoside 3'-phosphotransferase II